MIEIKCEIKEIKDDGAAIAEGRCKVIGDRTRIINELRVVFMQLEKSTSEDTFAEALDQWLTYSKGFKG